MNGSVSHALYFRFSRVRLLDVLARVAILASLVVAGAAVSGGLTLSSEAPNIVRCDTQRALALIPPSCDESDYFPLIRDYASLFHLIMIAIMGTYGDILIRGLAAFWRGAANAGILHTPSPNDQKWIARVDGGRQHAILDAAILGLGLAMCYFGMLGYDANGIYPALAVESSPAQFAHAAADSAWSKLPSLGAVTFLLVGGIGNYYILQIALTAVSSLRLGIGASWQDRLRVLPFAPDGTWGWREAFAAINAGVVTSVFGLLGLLALLLRGGYENLPYLLAFPVVAAFAVLPWTVINRVWQRAVTASLSETSALTGAPSATQRNSAERAYLSIQASRPRIVSTATTFFQLAFTVVPGLIAVAQASGFWGE